MVNELEMSKINETNIVKWDVLLFKYDTLLNKNGKA
jgi:hypothetical protein